MEEGDKGGGKKGRNEKGDAESEMKERDENKSG